ncbi:hypothetical protein A0J61_09256 [Choanephora cucurbitarum]|uniref:Uncharacterized protein n=1 Tax=Choanephora cucurbitarum TaxID=101091 RepID=A0A1C7N5R9_9FUNG|nr:hypothetical protein A0J61_09256 [Choanephora cucurbitarum]
MDISKKYEDYKLECDVEKTSLNYFKENSAKEWCFKSYLNKAHPEIRKYKRKNINYIYFCYLDDLKWIEDNKSLPREIRNYALNLKRDKLSTEELEKCTFPKPSDHQPIYTMHVSNNNCDVKIATNQEIYYCSNSRSTKRKLNKNEEKDRTKRTNIEDTDEDELTKKWKLFLEKAKHNPLIHKYSPAKNDIICCGEGISNKPSYPEDIYREYKQKHPEKKACFIDKKFIKYIDRVIDSSSIKQYKRNVQSTKELGDGELEEQAEFLNDFFLATYHMYQSLATPFHSESVFTYCLILPYLEMIAFHLSEIGDLKAACLPGEETLLSMSKCLKEKNGHFVYLADGVLRLQNLHDVELLLLEVSGTFLNTDMSKINFDHHKGMFGTLSMLKNIAKQFKYGDIKLFEKIKLFFLQGAGNRLRCWSVVYTDDVSHMWLEDTLLLKYDFEDKEEFLPRALNFFLNLKNNIQETLVALKELKESHKDNLRQSRYDISPSLLTDVVKPTIVRLTQSEHAKNMSSVGPFESSDTE